MNIPEDLLYAKTHEWLRPSGPLATVGITDHAQHELTDVVYVELPAPGTQVSAGQQICVVESVKAASDIYAPASGTVESVNDALISDPSLINSDPYGKGWIFTLRLDADASLDRLQPPAAYAQQLAGI
jgi:glycine cleavage system H protein